MVEYTHCQDTVENQRASPCPDFNGLACSRHREHIALPPMVIVLPEEGDGPRKLSSGFSTIIGPVFSSKWQWSQQNSQAVCPVSVLLLRSSLRSTNCHFMHHKRTRCQVRESVPRCGASQQGTT